jgi:predicted transcriptional regulator
VGIAPLKLACDWIHLYIFIDHSAILGRTVARDNSPMVAMKTVQMHGDLKKTKARVTIQMIKPCWI